MMSTRVRYFDRRSSQHRQSDVSCEQDLECSHDVPQVLECGVCVRFAGLELHSLLAADSSAVSIALDEELQPPPKWPNILSYTHHVRTQWNTDRTNQ